MLSQLSIENIALIDKLELTLSNGLNVLSGETGETIADLGACAVEAGADLLLMPADAPAAMEGLYEAVQNGQISQERIDESVRRILACKLEMGLIDTDTEGESE